MKLTTFSLLALMASAGASAQETDAAPASTEAVQVVEVSGVKNPELKPYRQMLKGLDAFEKLHSLAPAAPLKFQLVSDTRKIAFDTVTLKLSGKNTDVPLPVAGDGTFILPRLPGAAEDNAELVSNKSKGVLRWRGDIHTPGVPDNARRLGDLRLECEIGWAVNREDMPFLTRNSLSAIGGMCRSKMVGLRYQAPRPLANVAFVSGERKLNLRIDPANKRVYYPLLADSSWNDDTLIVYEFEDVVAANP
ncbi:hypothetical protein G4G28_01715 [Massilia sp. Dwa41.01b]|uniref:hypothetical protein n=1 Tax=unclassified Massilia TaxID=2609279 RepID=UPI0016027148|nr:MULTISPECIES: hypothetical protein [unclassified Massilia]QNA87496.1 hypothetical protein G4G28_01715 [Massilia sp. Dwa41.01b]QNA98403.1 hypothetical protein G4G31_05475 [Massilia sp. Se16.2.3]